MRFSTFYTTHFLLEAGTFSDWKGYVERTPELKNAVEVMQKIDAKGKDIRSYVVGGAVRDIVMGRDFNDVDIATNLPISEIEKMFKTHDIGKNKDFGIVVVDYKGDVFEIANFRQDGAYLDGRRPEDVKIVMSFEDDAGRRDFTVNAMGIDKDGNVIDFFDGKKDIKDKVIKTVGDPNKRFAEDYLRMLRAIRFGSKLGFRIDDDTMKAIKSKSHKIKDIAVERVMKEVIKMAEQEGSKFADAIITLKDAGLLQYIFPEIIEMDSFEHSVEHHPEGNVLQHTLAALKSSNSKDPLVNLSILFHDVGKLKTHEVDEKGLHRYFGHAEEAREIIENLAKRLKLDNETKNAMLYSAINHMKFHDFLKMSNSKIMSLMGDDNWDLLYQVALADAKARGEAFDEEEWKKITDKIDDLTAKYKSKKAIDNIRKIVNGRMVMDLLNMKGGPELGRIINTTIEWILDNNIDLNDIDKIKEFIISQRGE